MFKNRSFAAVLSAVMLLAVLSAPSTVATPTPQTSDAAAAPAAADAKPIDWRRTCSMIVAPILRDAMTDYAVTTRRRTGDG